MTTRTLLSLIVVCGMAAGALAGCSAGHVAVQQTSNPKMQVDIVARDADGYTIKRFSDGFYDHYYVTPGPARVSGAHYDAATKRTRYDEIETAR